jgi:hypothetical protein
MLKAKSATKQIGWQGFTVEVPVEWDLTGFSGSFTDGYFRVDDSESVGLEVKWATIGKKAKPLTELQITGRVESFLNGLKQTAKKKKTSFESANLPFLKSVERPERTGMGFRWSADKKAIGVVWYCEKCRRITIAQLLGEARSQAGLKTLTEKILGTMCCHSDDMDWNLWALYDLSVSVPAEFLLESQQLMNVYLRLSFATKGNARLTVEQWGLANVSRRGQYLDDWVQINTKGPMAQSRYKATESEVKTHPAIVLKGGLAFGPPLFKQMHEMVSKLQWPATRFSGAAWECETANKVFLISQLRPPRKKELDRVPEIIERIRCH